MKRTGPAELAVPLVLVGVLVYVLLRFFYDAAPRLQYLIGLPVAVLAVVELVLARRVRAAVRHHRDAKPMTAIAIARCTALGTSSALVGAGVVGAALGVLGRTVPDAAEVAAAGHDSRVVAVVAVAAVLLVAAGLVLERTGVDPGNDGRP